MTKEEKTLLMHVLCTMMPYGVKGKVKTTDGNGQEITDDGVLNSVFIDEYGTTYICIEGVEYELEDVKPYLRPMSSMTDEEWRKMHNCCNAILMGDKRICIEKSKFGSFSELQDAYTTIDWLLAHHFDYRGLIGMGLALEAPEGMYNNIKTK